MIIIVEGPDCTGKTRFAQTLTQQLGGAYLHFGAPVNETWYEEYVTPVEELLREYDHVVLDRGFFAEPMWAAIFERTRSLFDDSAGLEECTRWYLKHDMRIIMLTRPIPDIVDCCLQREETSAQIAKTLVSVATYEQLLKVLIDQQMPVFVMESDSAHAFSEALT